MLLSRCCQYLRLLVRTSVQISDSKIRFGYLILNFDIHDIPKIHLMLHSKFSKCLGAQHRPSRCRHASLPLMMNTFLGFNGVSLLFFSPGQQYFLQYEIPYLLLCLTMIFFGVSPYLRLSISKISLIYIVLCYQYSMFIDITNVKCYTNIELCSCIICMGVFSGYTTNSQSLSKFCFSCRLRLYVSPNSRLPTLCASDNISGSKIFSSLR